MFGAEGPEQAEGRSSGMSTGPACYGLSIADLFAHSYSPPAPQTKPYTHIWLWVATARVWDPKADRFLGRASEIRKFGQ